MDIEFNSLKELYEHVKPALEAKKSEMSRIGYNYIKEEDIWNYLKEIKWKRSFDLSLSELVDDILNTDELIIDNYVREKLNLKDRMIYFDGGVQDEE